MDVCIIRLQAARSNHEHAVANHIDATKSTKEIAKIGVVGSIVVMFFVEVVHGWPYHRAG
jgi:hypothetical protein